MTVGRLRGSGVWVILLIEFVLAKNFFPNLSGVRNYFPDIQRCKIFISIIRHIFFSAGYFSQEFICILFPIEISLQSFLKASETIEDKTL